MHLEEHLLLRLIGTAVAIKGRRYHHQTQQDTTEDQRPLNSSEDGIENENAQKGVVSSEHLLEEPPSRPFNILEAPHRPLRDHVYLNVDLLPQLNGTLPPLYTWGPPRQHLPALPCLACVICRARQRRRRFVPDFLEAHPPGLGGRCASLDPAFNLDGVIRTIVMVCCRLLLPGGVEVVHRRTRELISVANNCLPGILAVQIVRVSS
mmetsp:Transcript_23419/g.57867  ORF Transcript_23419/g.57867 Transcript_23419/m.57867 type:complete len:207 (+) Transcript_23419:529-1149(+)